MNSLPPPEDDEELDESDFRRCSQTTKLKWVRFNREFNDYLVTDLTSEELKDFRVFLVSFVLPFCNEDDTHLHEWAMGAKTLKARCKLHDIMCVGVIDLFVMTEMARKLGYEDRVSYIADWDASMTKWLRNDLETEHFGLKSIRSTGVLTDGQLRVKFSSAHFPLLYSFSVSPRYIWKHIVFKGLRCRLFL